MRRASIPIGRLALLLTAAAGPWCEAGAGARARERLAARADATFASWDLDLAGLHVFDARAAIGEHEVRSDEILVTATADGVEIHVRGLVSDRRAAPPPTSSAAATTDEAPASEPRGDRFRIANAGIPVRVVTTGTVHWPVGRGIAASITDPSVEIDAAGWPTIRADAALQGLAADAVVVDDAIITRSAGRWTIHGELGAPDGSVLTLDGSVDASVRTVGIRDADGATVVVTQSVGEQAATLDATDFPIGRAGPLLGAHAEPHGVRLDRARVGGRLELTWGAATRVHAEDVVVRDVAVDNRRLSARTVRLDEVSIDGDASLHGDRVELQLVVGHHDARVAIGGQVDREGVVLDLDVAELPCDALLDALPAGTADALVGMRLGGTIAAGAHLAVSFAALNAARGQGAEPPPEAPPGELSLVFPFLERCRTLADPANVDIAALRGPYRHRFADDAGRVRERVLAPGAADFAPLGRVPRLASAFIALEDMHYWYHDGFDREQIERAFWHNVVSGRVRRGASTISQQTARNLWLGVDRSIARKMQEAYLTTRLESGVSKTRILELYVNLVELGPGIYGVEAASQFYFGKPAAELDVLQAVHLASLAPAPVTYAERFADGRVDDAWMDELRGHVRRMHRNRMIGEAELRAALAGRDASVRLGLRDRTR